jgi:AcrR family transcriptional regulator
VSTETGPAAAARLTADDWAAAALEALLSEGPAGVAVQPLARRIGATKGSFYWHFKSRDELLRAALARWEETATEAVIRSTEAAAGDPREKARRLFGWVTASSSQHPGQLHLLAEAGHPDVRAALDRATRRRVGYVAQLLREAGQPAAVAGRRATLAYATYLGHAQLAYSTPGLLPATDAERRDLLDELTRILFAD